MAFWKRTPQNEKPTVSVSRPSLIQALEPRMMFDASVAIVADQGAQAAEAAAATSKDTSTANDAANTQDTATHEAAQEAAPGTAPATTAAGSHEVVFIDSAVSDYQKLIAGLPEGVEVVVLESGKDGFKQIADYLDGRSDVASIDIISHGDSGYVYLAGNAIWADQLASHSADLARIGASLVDGGDIRFFACNTGAGSEGALFVSEVARLSGADVGASSDSTGNRAGEDWELETVSGVVASGVGVQRGDLSAFDTSLATITVTDTDASSLAVNGKVSLAEAIQAANTNASVDGSAAGSGSDIIVFHESLKGQTIRWSSASALLVTSDITINGDVDGDGQGDIILSGDVNNNGTRDAAESAGLQSNAGGVLTLRNLDFRYFSGNLANGAVRANSGSVTIEDSNFQNNAGTAINSATTSGSTLIVRNTTIHDNSTTVVGTSAMSSLVRLGGPNNHVLENVAIYNNSGTLSAGTTVAAGSVIVVTNSGGTVRIINSTIANNTFTAASGTINSAGLGWAVGAAGTVTVQNSILTGNTVNGAAADAATNSGAGTGYASITNVIGSTVNFVNAAGGDYRLAASATNAIDQGTLGGAPTTDLRGFERPRGGAVDIGAYEVLYSAPPVVDLDTGTGGNNSSVDFTGTPVAIMPNISITQTDGDTQVSGATLNLTGIADGANETLSLSTAQIALAASYGITVSGSGTAVLTLSGVSTLGNYNTVLASVAYANSTGSYTAGARSVAVSVNDDMGSTNRTASVVVVPPNSAPVIGNLNGDSLTFTQGGGAVLIDAGGNATVSDIDSVDFAGGNLTVEISSNGVTGEDILGIRSAGQISVSGTDVTYAGVTIGTVAGGTGGANLVVTFNANATVTAVQALVRSVTYDNSNASNGIGQVSRGLTITVNDGDGGTSSAASVVVAVRETVPPTATISISDTTLKIGDTATVTITFSEAVTGFDNADLTIENGTLSAVSSADGGITWTATFTPTSGISDTTNLITLDNSGVFDAAGNAGSGTTDSNNYAIDTQRPTATIVVADSVLAVGETSQVTITFSEPVSGFTTFDLNVENGVVSGLSSSDGGITWTGTFTPTNGISDTSNVITLDSSGVIDLAGNAGSGTTDSNNYVIDTQRPTATIVVADSTLIVGETSLVTITFSEAVSGFDLADLSVQNGTLSGLSTSDQIVWTATLTPDSSISDTSNLITLNNTGVVDQAGNTGTGTTDSNNFAIDTLRPTATIVVANSSLSIGQTSQVTITFSEAVTGFTTLDLNVANGVVSGLSSADGGVTWTATLTPSGDISDTSNVITLNNAGVSDQAGNAGTGITESNNYAIDTQRPTATVVVSDTDLTAGETTTVTITFSEAVTGFTLTDLSAISGALSNLSSADGGVTWTATLTPDVNVQANGNIVMLNNTGVVDQVGNTGSGLSLSNVYSVNTRQPTATLFVADTALRAGETSLVTITFSEAVSGFTLLDLNVANGVVSGLSSGDGGITWTATFTPDSDVQDLTNVITLDNSGVVGASSGNPGTGTTDSNNYAIDTLRPTATIVVANNSLSIGQTSLVTITFSEAVTGFSTLDLNVANGVLSGLSSLDGGLTWTATLTPSGNTSDTSNVITFNNAGVSDQAGNTGTGITESNNYAIDTQRPTATISVSDTDLTVGETATVTITFNEAVSGFGLEDLSVTNGTLSNLSSVDGIVWIATLTPAANVRATNNLVTLANYGVADQIGNVGVGTTDSANFSVNTVVPTATIIVADPSLRAGESSQVTITFSEAVSGFSNADLTLANGTLSAVSSADGGVTWTATFTPDSDVQDVTNVITLDNSGVVGASSGNPGTGTTDSNNYAIDTLRPTATIVVANNSLSIGQTSLVTITFSEAVTGFSTLDLNVANGVLSGLSSLDGGLTWTATLTPSGNTSDTSNVITFNNAGVSDQAGNTGTGITESNNYAIDTQRPTATISVSDTDLTVGETATVTITFNEAVSGFGLEDLSVTNGTLSNLSSVDGIVWIATLTPAANVRATNNLVTLANYGVADQIGNVGVGTTDSANFSVNTVVPTATIIVADPSLRAGESSQVTITFSEAVSGFSNADLTLANGTLSAVSSADGGVTWTATFTPDSDVQDVTNVITLDNSGVVGASSGNPGTGTTDSNNYAIDTLRPTATIVVANNSLSIGQTSLVTITFSEAVSGFTTLDLNVANGVVSGLSSADGGVTWTATLTPGGDISDTSNVITLNNAGVSDQAGNTGTGITESNNYAVDTQRPTATISLSDTALTVGETATVTITFSEAVSDFGLEDLSVTNGTLSNLSSADGIVWTATFTPASDVQDVANVITLNNAGVSDQAGNSGSGTTDSNTFAIDTHRPTATIVVANSSLSIGQTSLVTITFSEAVSGFGLEDLSVANGVISGLSSADGGITWTATLTPSGNISDTSNVITLNNTGVTDQAGNAGVGTTDSNNFAIDTLRPTATIVVANSSLSIGQTSQVTITFSEAVTGFTTLDLNVANGVVSGLSSADGGVTWTATLTPSGNISDTSNVITLNNAGVSDQAGNTGTGITESNNYAIDTQRPTATISLSDTALTVGETATVTITFSEAVSDFGLEDLSVTNGTLSNLSSADGIVWTATFTPASDVQDVANVITLNNSGVTDQAGNSGSGTTDSYTYAIDTLRPTATIVVANNSLSIGQTSLVTITFSEAVSGFGLEDLSVANGVVSGLSSADGGITWTATLTPSGNISDTSNVITLNNTGVTDQAGNAGTGTTDSNNYAIDTQRPSATIVVASNSLSIGQTSQVIITFSEAVSGFTTLDLNVANGVVSGLSSADGGVTWTATLTPSGNISDTSNVITLNNAGVSDQAGNTGTGITESNNYAVDTQRPTATISLSDTDLTVGETATVTITFSEAVSDFGLEDLSVTNGTLSNLSSVDGIVWIATLTPAANVRATSNLVTLANSGVADQVGNVGVGTTDSANFTVNTMVPTATIIVADPALRAGESSQVTITFSEAVGGFSNADLSIANGTLSTVSSVDGGITWTATFTPASDVQDVTNVITLDNTGVVGALSGNAGVGTTDSNNFAIDTLRPTATIVVANNSLNIGQTSLVTITFSEVVSGFTTLDLNVANGVVSGLSSADGGITWTATLTPSEEISDTSNVITLNNAGVSDQAGNAGTGTTESNNYAIDTQRPTATISVSDTDLTVGETATVTITFSETVSGFGLEDLNVTNGTLSNLSSVDGIVWTATFTPASDVQDVANVITLNNAGVTDQAGNSGSATTDSNTFAIDTQRPTATIVVANSSLSIGQTSLVTITFSEAVSGFGLEDLSVTNGTLSNLSSADGIVWTATFTPANDVQDAASVITLNNTGVTDHAGNSGSGTTSSNTYTIDTQRPTATVVVANSSLGIGQTSLVTITFSEAVSGFGLEDLSVANGVVSGLSSADGGITWTAILTPSGSISDTSNVITLNNAGVSDQAGNAGTGTTDSNNYAIDTQRPTATISVSDTNLTVGETATVTITFSEAVSGFGLEDLSVASGTLSNLSSADGVVWTATFTPANDVQDVANVITLNNAGVTDQAGNSGSATTDSNTFAIDTQRPTATIVVANSSLSIGQTSLVTITFSEAVTGFTTLDLNVANGVISGLSSADGGITWTATLKPSGNISDTGNVITLNNAGVSDQAGNAGTGTTESNNYAIDTQRPTATISVSDTDLTVGETATVTITFSEAVSGFGLEDLSVTNGTLSNLSSVDGIVWIATLTPAANVRATNNLVTLANSGVADQVGNVGVGTTDSANFSVNTVVPTATIIVADPALRAGESSQVTITFSEAVSGFSNADLTLANGTLSAVSSADGGVTWTATFTPASDVQDGTNIITLDNTGIVGAQSGNAGVGTTDSNNFAIDTQRPTAQITVTGNLIAGQTGTATITFSEAVSNLSVSDLIVSNASLSGLQTADGGVTWTAVLTPVAGNQSSGNRITLDTRTLTDAAGNHGDSTVQSNDYLIDTRAPSVTSVGVPVAGVTYNAGDALVFVVNASEAVEVNGTPRLVLDVGGRTVFAELTAGAGTPTLVFQYIIQAGDNDSKGISVTGLQANGATLRDAQGNAMDLTLNGIADTGHVLIDTQVPTAIGIVTLDPSPSNAQSVRFTVTFSERVNGVDLSDFSLALSGTASGVLSGVRLVSDGVYEITVNNVSGTGTLGLNLNASGTGISDVGGNLLGGGLTGPVYSIDRDVPTVSSVSVPVGVPYNAGDTLTFVVNTSEAVIVDGAPRLALDIGGRTVFADFVAGSGTPTLVFQYRIQAGDNDADGIQVVGLAANGAALRDATGNALNPGLNAVGDSRGVVVDTRLPSVESIVPAPVAGSASQSFTVTFSENVRGVDLGDFELVATGNAVGSLQSLVQIDGRTWQVNVAGVAGTGSLALALKASGTGISDVAGNVLQGGFVGQGRALQSTDGDPLFRAYTSAQPGFAAQGVPVVAVPGPALAPFQSPLLPAPLFDVPSVGGNLPPLGSIFIRSGGLAPSYLAQVFAGQQGGIDNDSGASHFGFGGGEANVFGGSTLANIFVKTIPGDGGPNELTGGKPPQTSIDGAAGRALSGAPTLGQQLQAFKDSEQRHARNLELALGQIEAARTEA
ncbi:MAG: Ig-like domain-containing protein [Candidatus Pseudomonas phytovorans]|uniref:Ig-like domain-containing protein n=1 Tax=Candidatus Pseudomonas phytovorans TaxID=3121377 RepID=A0AAJ6BDM1_9PSED|nr:Ig-like domain-containing protein [Pseudomonas sp.]WEK32362.1 MAG: Ig-like domain-containing protein [Pseudomonas sp.]